MSDPTSAEIEQQILALQNPAGTEPQAQPAAQPAQTQPPEPVQSGQGEPEPQGQPSSDVPAQGTQVETPAAVPTELDKLMKEKGITDPNLVAKMYHDLQADHTRKSQELAKLRAQEGTQPTTPQPAMHPAGMEELNAKFVEDLAKNPLATIAKVVDALAGEKVKPFEATQKQALLDKEIIRLSTSPETAHTFNLKQVQDEMKIVAQEDPTYLDNLPKKLLTLHDSALGRLVRRGFTVNAPKTQIPSQTPPPEGGANKPSPAQTIDVKKASAAELEAYINSLPK
jgi:hypothetical protein